jgi:hypothetical protein
MRRNRVDRALVLTSYKVNPGRPSTREVVEATAHLPNLHVVAGLSWTTFGPADVEELRELLDRGAEGAEDLSGLRAVLSRRCEARARLRAGRGL